ncbi:hypothetical protein FUAX_02590 [Fulvitalea axinellae]|uniref:Probable endolytic peptidoglycan transglycosylase RlpA n=1 Tax=Fulvitalea axinellae TaxID=1182444 RepID=A0AAU9CIZ2_9BACT|nr:hypothetical protein FUAX_02590 [Fulvitalea axinellae]
MRHLFVCLLLLLPLASTAQKMTFVQNGVASFYHNKFNGRKTANGEIFSNKKMTAAHLSLPFNTLVRVTNKKNNKSVTVRINDRGPYAKGRIIDLSHVAASRLGFVQDGTAQVRVEVVSSPGGNKPAPVASGGGKSGGKSSGKVTKGGSKKASEPKREFFAIESKQYQPTGFGVQVGSFRELDNIVRLTSGLGGRFGCQILVEVAYVNGHKYYRVSLGTFKTRKRAESVTKGVKSEFPDAFVITFPEKENS